MQAFSALPLFLSSSLFLSWEAEKEKREEREGDEKEKWGALRPDLEQKKKEAWEEISQFLLLLHAVLLAPQFFHARARYPSP